MKLLLVGDTHFRVRAPQRRTDKNFMWTCLDKLKQVYDIADEYECEAIIQVGDFFDSDNPSKALVIELIRMMKPWHTGAGPDFYAIHGQHDQAFHNQASMSKSALRILEAAGCLTLLDDATDGMAVTDGQDLIAVYGASFGQDPPKKMNRDCYKVLVSHVMVGDKPLWPGQELASPKAYMKKHPGFDLYVVGDYHYPFTYSNGKATMVNPGALLRLTADERDRCREPKVVLFDTKTGKAENLYLAIRSWEEAFDLSGMDEKKDTHQYDELVEKLRSSGHISVSFAENLQRYLDENDEPEAVRELLWANLERVE